ncbi:MAG: GNAT family N-acetyltransferase [Alphaproteobacteria bacterium]|nr:GNAT family N-acetyltransferase [Alphaproteobacteria bacterium]
MNSIHGLDAVAFTLSAKRGEALVRPLQLNDFEAWRKLWRGYLEFYETNLPAHHDTLVFSRLLDDSEPMFAFLAIVGDEALGLVQIILHRSTWLAAPSCYLQDLYVEKKSRGTGIGRALIEHVYEVIARAGGARVHWLTHETNITGQQLYDRIAKRTGFIQYAKAV